jgi:hypothetical protein
LLDNEKEIKIVQTAACMGISRMVEMFREDNKSIAFSTPKDVRIENAVLGAAKGGHLLNLESYLTIMPSSERSKR